MQAVADRIEAVVGPLYAHKDAMHDLAHARRLLREALALARAYPEADETVIILGAYLHGVVWSQDEADLVATLANEGYATETVRRALQAAWESQKGQTPTTLEGTILHDGHLLEGGRTFIVVKALVVGAARGETLEQSISFIEDRILGRYRCHLPEAQAAYSDKEQYARLFLADLKASI